MAEEYDQEPAASPEEQLQIAQHFLLSSPPGQLSDVLQDVRALLPPGLLTDATLAGIFRAYNTEQFKVVPVPGTNRKMLLSRVGEVDPTHYIDPEGGQVVGIDHANQTVIETDMLPLTGQMDAALESERAATQTAINTYMNGRFCTQGGAAASAVYAKDGKLTVILSGEKINLRNFWSGSWRSSFEINPSSGAITGSIRVHVHYFEDGNVQLNNTKEVPAGTVNSGDPETLAASIVEYIMTSENSVQAALEEMYSNMNEETFKEMRRTLPISRTRFEWNAAAHRLVRTFRQ
mmetsp:Transcript_16225/g.32383  ORF Transcript_16225/g.32383 Transcript_16225/m.32383 type:complete len:291 (-) Transcript_16225:18-890(-)